MPPKKGKSKKSEAKKSNEEEKIEEVYFLWLFNCMSRMTKGLK